MYSNISEAWGHDPVREITTKLSKKINQSNNNMNNFLPEEGGWSNQINGMMTGPGFNNVNDVSDISDARSLSLASEYTIGTETEPTNRKKDMNKRLKSLKPFDARADTYAPVHFDKYMGKKRCFDRFEDSDSEYTFIENEQNKSKCRYSIKHLENCDRCYNRLKDLIASKVNKKIDQVILDNKLKQIQNISLTPNTHYAHDSYLHSHSHSHPNQVPNNGTWKETTIIVIGIIIALFIIYLIIRTINK